MSKLFKQQQSVSKLGKHGHDLSRRLCFTSSCGQLLPVLFDYLSPGDSVNIQSNLFTRTQPLKTPSFVRLDEHIDYFFVPMHLIDSYFGNAFYGINDFSNGNDSLSADTFKAPVSMCLLDLKDVESVLKEFSAHKDVMQVGDEYSSEHLDEYHIPLQSNLVRLFSHLGYGEKVCGIANDSVIRPSFKVNVYPLFVYQRIFSDYYRDTEYTSNNPYLYNLNSYYKNNNLLVQLRNMFQGKDSPFKLRYHGTKKDYFTSFKPTPVFGQSQVNSYGSTNPDLNPQGMILSSYGISPEYNRNHPNNSQNSGVFSLGINGNYTALTSTSTAYVDLAAIRTAYAMDKMNRITAKNGKHYDKQTLAHFGIDVPSGLSNEVVYLGSHSQLLNIGEVVSTATTGSGSDSSVLGELAGRGASSSTSKPIKYTAHCHGFIMAIYSSVPDIQYSSFGVDRINQYANISDFYHPEFDRLGMQPIYDTEYTYHVDESPTFIGWQYRYIELKTSYDKVIGSFNYTLQDWVPTHNNTFINGTYDVNEDTDIITLFKYVSPNYLDNIFSVPFEPPYLTSDDNHKVWAVKGKSQMIVPSPVFERDPLLHSLQFKYYKSSCMSPYGEPVV